MHNYSVYSSIDIKTSSDISSPLFLSQSSFAPNLYSISLLGVKDTHDFDSIFSPYLICRMASTDLTCRRFLNLE